MRPSGWYVVLEFPNPPIIVHGYKTAQELTPGRCYVRFETVTAAEEFAAWWTYEHPPGVSVNTTE